MYLIYQYYPHRFDPDEERKYIELMSSPIDETVTKMGTPGLIEAVQRIGMKPDSCVEMNDRHYYPDAGYGPKTKIVEPLLGKPGSDVSSLTVRVLQAYRMPTQTRGFSFGAPTQSEGVVQETDDSWYLEANYKLKTANNSKAQPQQSQPPKVG